jgi:hypothetical protein
MFRRLPCWQVICVTGSWNVPNLELRSDRLNTEFHLWMKVTGYLVAWCSCGPLSFVCVGSWFQNWRETSCCTTLTFGEEDASVLQIISIMYKVVEIWPGQTVTCLHTNSPGHIWTTLYTNCKIQFLKIIALFVLRVNGFIYWGGGRRGGGVVTHDIQVAETLDLRL